MDDFANKWSARRGHRASTMKMIHKAEDLLAQDIINCSQLVQIRVSLQEKLNTLKWLDMDIVDLVKNEEVADMT